MFCFILKCCDSQVGRQFEFFKLASFSSKECLRSTFKIRSQSCPHGRCGDVSLKLRYYIVSHSHKLGDSIDGIFPLPYILCIQLPSQSFYIELCKNNVYEWSDVLLLQDIGDLMATHAIIFSIHLVTSDDVSDEFVWTNLQTTKLIFFYKVCTINLL